MSASDSGSSLTAMSPWSFTLLIRRDFVANDSHELQTPLTVISGFLENLTDSPLTLENHRWPIQLISRQATRMRSIIEDLLTLSRLEMEYTTTQSEPVDVPETLRSILDEAKLLDAEEHALSEGIAQNLLPKGNQLELRSVFSNLLFNAIKHTPLKSRIRITWQKDGENGPLFARTMGKGLRRSIFRA